MSRTVYTMKQSALVYDALAAGALTSTEIARLTKLSVKRCSSHLSALADSGVIRKTGRTLRQCRRGHVSYCYEVCR